MNQLTLRKGLLLAASCMATVLAQAQENPNPNPEVDAFIEEEMTSEQLPGVATVIVKDGQIVWLQAYGLADVENQVPVSPNTSFLLASVSKLFTGLSAMHLASETDFSIDDDVNDYLPWQVAIPGYEDQPITPRQLMTHTSSIIDDFNTMDAYYDYPDPAISLAECMERYLTPGGVDYDPEDNFLEAAPGTEFEYSNMGTALNGYVVEVASGQPFDTYCNTHLFEPMCMENTAWFFADLDSANVARPHSWSNGTYTPYPHFGFADYPDGQLRSSAIDLANFMIACLNDGAFGEAQVLPEGTLDAMWTPQLGGVEGTMGLNWYEEVLFHDGGTATVWGHNGGEQGTSTDLYIDPVNNIGLCVLANGEGSGLFICDELYNYALSLDPASGYPSPCLTTSVLEVGTESSDRELVKVIDMLGRETKLRLNTPLIKIYSDGSTERVFITE